MILWAAATCFLRALGGFREAAFQRKYLWLRSRVRARARRKTGVHQEDLLRSGFWGEAGWSGFGSGRDEGGGRM